MTIPTIDTFANLALNPQLYVSAPQGIHLQGAAAPGDGGGGQFYWDPTAIGQNDGGTVNSGWRRIYEHGRIHAGWFGVSAASADNSAALNAAFAVARAVGGTLVLPPGLLKHATALVLDGASNLSIEGASIYQANHGALGTTLQYTGAGSVAISALSTNALSFKRLCFNPVATFSGAIVGFGHLGSSGADCANVLVEECCFQGNYLGGATDPTPIGLFLGYTINSTIRDSWFIDLYASVFGSSDASTPHVPYPGGYSYSCRIESCSFGLAPIRNPHLRWTVDGCQFEGPTSWPAGVGYAIDEDSGGATTSLAVRGCNFGDGPNVDVWISLQHASTVMLSENEFEAGSRCAVAFQGQNLLVYGNELAGNAVDFPTANGAGQVTVFGNRGLVITNAANAGIDGSIASGYQSVIFANQGSGTYVPPVLVAGSAPLQTMGGLQLNTDGSVISNHYHAEVDAPAWSVSPVSSGGTATLLVALGSVPAKASVDCTLVDPAAQGVIVTGVVYSGTHVQVTLVNMSGAAYTPSTPLLVDLWVH